VSIVYEVELMCTSNFLFSLFLFTASLCSSAKSLQPPCVKYCHILFFTSFLDVGEAEGFEEEEVGGEEAGDEEEGDNETGVEKDELGEGEGDPVKSCDDEVCLGERGGEDGGEGEGGAW